MFHREEQTGGPGETVKPVHTKSLCVCVSSLDHYSQMSDVQTLAMLCSVFRAQTPPDSFSLYGHHPSRASMFPHTTHDT